MCILQGECCPKVFKGVMALGLKLSDFFYAIDLFQSLGQSCTGLAMLYFLLWVGVKQQIANVEEEIKTVQKEVDYCKDYRDVEQHKNKKRINLLEADIDDMEASFQEMKGTLTIGYRQASRK
jgi:hypothetical protein